MDKIEDVLSRLHSFMVRNHSEAPDVLIVRLRSGRKVFYSFPVPVINEGPPKSPVKQPEELPTRHSDDFRSVNWHGVTYQFNDRQAQVIRVLWEAAEDGMPDVSKATLLEAAESDSKDLRDLFRGAEGAYHPAWRGMIVKSTRLGWYRLNSDLG